MVEKNSGARRQTFEGYSGSVGTVVFSLGGKLVASGSEVMTVRLWECSTAFLADMYEGYSGVQLAFREKSCLRVSGELKATKMSATYNGSLLRDCLLSIDKARLWVAY